MEIPVYTQEEILDMKPELVPIFINVLNLGTQVRQLILADLIRRNKIRTASVVSPMVHPVVSPVSPMVHPVVSPVSPMVHPVVSPVSPMVRPISPVVSPRVHPIVSPVGLNQELLEASERGNEVKVQELLAQRADVNYQESIHGETPLISAATNGHTTIAQFLINNGADLELADYISHATPYMRAAYMDNSDMARLLANNGANPNTVNEDHKTALTEAVLLKSPILVRSLVESRTDPNIKSHEGYTPLMYAAYNQEPSDVVISEEIVKTLLNSRADPSIMAHPDQDAIALATMQGNDNLTNIILPYMH